MDTIKARIAKIAKINGKITNITFKHGQIGQTSQKYHLDQSNWANQPKISSRLVKLAKKQPKIAKNVNKQLKTEKSKQTAD